MRKSEIASASQKSAKRQRHLRQVYFTESLDVRTSGARIGQSKRWVLIRYRRNPAKPLLHKYYSHPIRPLGRLAMGLIELKRPRNGDLPWIWNCKIWKNHKPQKVK